MTKTQVGFVQSLPLQTTQSHFTSFCQPIPHHAPKTSYHLPTAPSKRARLLTMTVANTSTQTLTDNKSPDPSEIASRKYKLLQAIAPLEMGMTTLDDESAQAEIETLIKSVEEVNPTSNPAKSPLRKGRWRLLYTESPIVLGRNRPGFVRPEKAWQVIDIEDEATEGKVMNEEEGSTKFLKILPVRWSNVITGKIKGLKDGVRFRQKFEEFKLGKWFKVPFPANVVGWQDQTFLDDELRIARTHFGNVFVMKRED